MNLEQNIFQQYIVPALLALLGGLVSLLIAPYVNWGIKKKELLRADRKEFIAKARKEIAEYKDVKSFLTSALYQSLKKHLSQSTQVILSSSPPTAARSDGAILMALIAERDANKRTECLKEALYQDVVVLEQKWKLI